MLKVNYYVTREGLKAGIANTEVLNALQAILLGDAHPMTIRAFQRRGLIDIEHRIGPRIDHNALVLSGGIERLREVLVPVTPEEPDPTPTVAKPTTTYAMKSAPEPQFSPTVEKVRTVMQTFDHEVTYADLANHQDLKGMNPGTLRWAIQMLRRAGVCESRKAA